MNSNAGVTPGNVGDSRKGNEKVDIAAEVVGREAQQYDAAIERRVVRRIDLFVIPFLWIGYGFV
jgi:hypothetical protein